MYINFSNSCKRDQLELPKCFSDYSKPIFARSLKLPENLQVIGAIKVRTPFAKSTQALIIGVRRAS
jgi:hypothetical protein